MLCREQAGLGAGWRGAGVLVFTSGMGSTLMVLKLAPARNLCPHFHASPGGVSMQGRDNEMAPQAGAKSSGTQQMVSGCEAQPSSQQQEVRSHVSGSTAQGSHGLMQGRAVKGSLVLPPARELLIPQGSL